MTRVCWQCQGLVDEEEEESRPQICWEVSEGVSKCVDQDTGVNLVCLGFQKAFD